MAKAKKRVTRRKKTSKKSKVSAKSARKKAAKRVKRRQGKSKVKGAARVAAKKRRPSKTAPRKAAKKTPEELVLPVEDTIVDVIEEPVPGVVVVTEYETIRTGSPTLSSPASKRGMGPETEEE